MRLNELLVLLTEGYKEAQQEFTQAANNDAEGVQKLIQAYKDLVNKNQVQGSERNIDFWRKQGFDKFKDFVVSKESVPTATAVKRKKLPGRSITVKEDDNWLIVIPLDKNASCFHGKDSDWCTTKPEHNYFETYFYDRSVTLIYCLNKKTSGMWAIATHANLDEIEMFDKEDSSITAEEFKQQTGLNPLELTKLVGAKGIHKPEVDASRNTYKDAVKELTKNWESYDFKNPNPEVEKLLLKILDPKLCAQYITYRFEKSNSYTFKEDDVPVTVPTPILLAGASYNEYIIDNIDVNALSTSTKIQIYKRNKDTLPTLIQAGWRPDHAAQKTIVEIDPDAIFVMLEKQVLPSIQTVLYIIDKDSPDNNNRPVVNLIKALVRYKIKLPPVVIDAAIKKNGYVVDTLLHNGYELSPEDLMTAIKSNGHTLEVLQELGYEITPEMEYESVKASKGWTFSSIPLVRRNHTPDARTIDLAIEQAPMASIDIMIHYDRATDEMLYKAVSLIKKST